MITQRKFLIAEQEFERELFGNFDENIKLIEFIPINEGTIENK